MSHLPTVANKPPKSARLLGDSKFSGIAAVLSIAGTNIDSELGRRAIRRRACAAPNQAAARAPAKIRDRSDNSLTAWIRPLSTPRSSRPQQRNTRASETHKTTDHATFRFEPSAIDGRYIVSIETETPPYVKFGAVLTRQEVEALIECLSRGLRDTEDRTG
jgi:hypothetical protein